MGCLLICTTEILRPDWSCAEINFVGFCTRRIYFVYVSGRNSISSTRLNLVLSKRKKNGLMRRRTGSVGVARRSNSTNDPQRPDVGCPRLCSRERRRREKPGTPAANDTAQRQGGSAAGTATLHCKRTRWVTAALLVAAKAMYFGISPQHWCVKGVRRCSSDFCLSETDSSIEESAEEEQP